MSQLDFSTPNLILYLSNTLKISILGGIELYHLDRMRVTLKIEVIHRDYPEYLEHPEIAALAIRQNLDLYNDHRVEKLCRKQWLKTKVMVFLLEV